MTSTPQERTLAAEVRAVEEGHKARLAGDGKHFLVSSDTHPGVTYYVRVTAVAGTVVFECDHPTSLGFGVTSRTTVPCKHAALAARRLEREGLLRWTAGRWEPTPALDRWTQEQLAAQGYQGVAPDSDPFAGLG